MRKPSSLQGELSGCGVTSGLICSQETERFGKGDGSATIIHAELAIDIVRMHLDRSRRDHQFAGNLLVREVLIELAQNA